MVSSINMLLIKAVGDSKVRALWAGQVFSAIGDEIYRVAFVWLCVQIVGSETGYLASLQLLASLLTGIFGARFVEHLHSEDAMIRLDLYRAAVVLIPVSLYLFHVPSFVALVLCGLVIGGLSALFEPVIAQTIPKVATERTLLVATNGLMSTTFRLARVVGPMIVSFLSAWVPMIHFFTLDAVSFLVSAYSVHSLRIPKGPPKKLPPFKWTSFLDSLVDAGRVLRKYPPVYRTLISKCVTGGAWWLAYGVGFALLANEMSPGNVKTFGLLVSCYGVGNIASALYFGSIHRRNPEKMIYPGLLWLGVSFLALSLSHSLVLVLLFSALSAIGGPWNDLPFADLVQQNCKGQEIFQIYRLRNILETLFQLVLMIFSPVLFKAFGIRGVIGGCGVLSFLMAAWGEWGRRQDPAIAATPAT